MDKKTHWKQLVNLDYIGAYSLQGRDLTVKITGVSVKRVKGEGGKEEDCTVATLEGQKPFIFNRTNAKTVTKLFGSPYIEDWVGKSITLFPTKTKVAGEEVECLRIRPILPKTVDYTKEIESDIANLKACKTLADLQKAYSAAKHPSDLKVIAMKDKLKTELS